MVQRPTSWEQEASLLDESVFTPSAEPGSCAWNGASPELALWRDYAPARVVLLLHDCGNGHGPRTLHHALRTQVEQLGIAGAWLRNPRGGFLGMQSRR